MKHPWANLLLLAFVAVESATGFFGLISGSPDRAIYIILHRVAGFGLVAVLVWKVLIVLFALRNRRRPAYERWTSIALFALLVVVLGLGFAWSMAGPYYYRLPTGYNWSGVSWHIYLGALLLPVVVWHAVTYTTSFHLPWTFWAERRSFLRFAALAIAGLALWRVSETGVQAAGLSGRHRRFTGSYAATRPGGEFPVVSWLNDTTPNLPAFRWELSISGDVGREMSLRLGELGEEVEQVATIDCTGGWHSEQVWRGARLSDLLAMAEPLPEARSVEVVSATGYYRRFSLREAEDFLLATRVGNRTLPLGHGYPARLVAPGKRGFDWVKWVTEIRVDSRPKWLQPPLPLQ